MKKFIGSLLCFLLLAGCTSADEIKEENSQGSVENRTEIENTEEILTDPIIDWDEKKVVIPELENEYEVWLFADSHITLWDSSDSEEVQSYAAERKNVFVNDTGRDSSQILSEFIQMANEHKPDMILFGGDIIDFPSDANVAFLKSELERLTVPYLFVMGNHDWTYPWEYMTPDGVEKYRPLLEDVMFDNFEKMNDSTVEIEQDVDAKIPKVCGNTYFSSAEFEDVVFLAVDDSSNQIAAEAVEGIEQAYALGKPIVLLQHVPFSTENLIMQAKEYWKNPVTLGMQVHGGIAPNSVSADLFGKVYDKDSLIRAVLSGHLHFSYEEQISESTVEIITDAAYKGKAVKLYLSGK